MLKGFFSSKVHKPQPVSRVPRCGACGLYKGCNSPKMPVAGIGQRRVLVVAEAPGAEEDKKGRPLIGESGQLFREQLERLGWDLDRDCWTTNTLICRPPINRTPTSSEIGYCLPNLLNTIRELKPKTIILLGASAVESLIGHLWHDDLGVIGRWAGWKIPSQDLNAWVCPTWHPAYLMRNRNDAALNLWFDKHLEAALGIENRPYGTDPFDDVPDYRKQVRVILDADEAARCIRREIIHEQVELAAFDFETDRLKPDAKDSRIVCCSIAWTPQYSSEEIIAYPWHGVAIKATQEFIRSLIPKVGHNIKFESRWGKAKFGHGVRNWKWDSMLAAHVLDNRPGICSLKFQAFVRLGFVGYEGHIKPFLKASGSRAKNRIHEVDVKELLLYCGLDSLVTLKIARQQMEEMNSE